MIIQSVDYPLSLISRSCNQAQTAIRNQRIQTTPDDSVGQHKVSSATNIVRDGTTCCATCFGRSTASSHSEANRIVIRSIKHLSDADSGQYPSLTINDRKARIGSNPRGDVKMTLFEG
ncbi:hypothetical protein BLNAU_20821 [Blattamonas nauphoetae]|uniref:Uncharacterized protein n=1 Tax=Blattamonas nauphoetae TaxID=2049346 RepID=A0ABQ9WXL7_9EUKA|nr:hypothetical protein BLNAU_20821 [Blattamonas nauphoetae]